MSKHKENCQCVCCKHGRKESHPTDCRCSLCLLKRGQSHRLDCKCFICKSKRKEPHKDGCNCWACKSRRGEMKGENHTQWKGGISRLPYSFEFTQELRDKIRKRDNFTCQNEQCSMTEEEHLIVYGKALDVHHIDYDKKNCNESNLISLCRQCNMRANHNRYIWTAYYRTLISCKF